MSHGDRVEALPTGFHVAGAHRTTRRSQPSRNDCSVIGLQFHPEVAHTASGQPDPAAISCSTSAAARQLDAGAFVERGDRGDPGAGRRRAGVLRAVAAGSIRPWPRRSMHRAIGDQLRCIFVDNGLLRHGERDGRRARFERAHPACDLVHVDATDRFLTRLDGGRPIPRRSARSIGDEFIRVFEAEAAHARARSTSWPRARSTRTSSRARATTPRRGREDQDAPQRRRPARQTCRST